MFVIISSIVYLSIMWYLEDLEILTSEEQIYKCCVKMMHTETGCYMLVRSTTPRFQSQMFFASAVTQAKT